MADYEPIELRAYYRAGHSTLWELAEGAGILRRLGISLKSLEFCDSSAKAEKALLDGSIDLVAGNHITPYLQVAQGKPIVCIASPGNSVKDSVVSREPITSLADLRGKRIADTSIVDQWGGYHHIRGNHMLDVKRAGLDLAEVEWVEVADMMGEEFRTAQWEALKSGTAHATFATGNLRDFEEAGFHILPLDTLPMITGPTITTSLGALDGKDRLGERLVKAMLLTIHFARTRREEADRILGPSSSRMYAGRGGRAGGMARLPMRPYPDPQGVANAYELCSMQHPETRAVSPLALWDLHYLRELDDSGFIDELEQEASTHPPSGSGGQ